MPDLTARLAALLLVAAAASTLAAEYFLSPNGDDGNPGTRERPWKTIAHANTTLQPGDTATFLDGEYPGVIEPANSGAEDAPVAYRALNRHQAVLTGGKGSNDKLQAIFLQGKEHVVIDGFAILPERGTWGLLQDCRHCTVQNCHMEKSSGVWAPFLCQNCHYNRYLNNRYWRAIQISKQGHILSNCFNNTGCTHNVFEGNHFKGVGHCPFMLWFDSEYNVVRRNVFDNRWGRNFELFTPPHTLVEENIITNGFDGSGSADGRAKLFTFDGIFRRNLIFRNHYGPLVINAYKRPGGNEIFGMQRTRIYHNTFYRNHEYGFEMSDLRRDGKNPQMVHDNVFANNIFFDNGPGGGHLALLLWASIAEDNRFVSNVLCGDRPGRKTVRYDLSGPEVTEWPGLVMTAAEANEQKPEQFEDNLDVEPRFADAEADDYRLRDDSPCIDASRPLARATKAGNGRELPVEDARCFYDGFGIPGEQGDLIMIGADRRLARVVRVDTEAHMLTLDRDAAWGEGDPVSLPYAGNAPDIGAHESGAEGQEWHRAPNVPPGLRVTTMETADEPTVVVDFEEENREDWFYLWNFSRQRNTDAAIDDTTAASGQRSMRVFATKDEAIMSCDIRPRWWDIDRFPTIRFSYRIPPGVPVGVWLYAFRSAEVGRGAVCAGGSPSRQTGSYTDLKRYELRDDDQWHEITIDARVIREVFADVKLLQMFRFYTTGNGMEGQQYWFDNFRLLPPL